MWEGMPDHPAARRHVLPQSLVTCTDCHSSWPHVLPNFLASCAAPPLGCLSCLNPSDPGAQAFQNDPEGTTAELVADILLNQAITLRSQDDITVMVVEKRGSSAKA